MSYDSETDGWIKGYAKLTRSELLAETRKWVAHSGRHKAALILLDEMDGRERADALIAEERRHRELVEAMKSAPIMEPATKSRIKFLGTIGLAVVSGLIVAYFKGCWPMYLR